MLAADVARERDARRAAEEPEFHAGSRELRVRRRDREIALRDELAAGGECETVHARDHGLRYAGEAYHETRAARESIFHERRRRVRAHFLQIVAGAERFAGAGDDDDAHAFIASDVVERFLKRIEQR